MIDWRGVLPYLCALATAGCLAPTIREPLRAETVADLAPDMLGFRRGATTLDEARSTLRLRHLTGIVDDGYAREQGGRFEVLAADYQSRVHLFRDGTYEQSLTLATHGLPPYGIALRIAKDGPSDVLLVLYRDPLARVEEPPTLLSFRVETTALQPLGRASLEGLVARHGGMSAPILVGNDLADGVMLVARDREGELWDTSYLLRFESGKLALEPKPMTEALRCSCVRAYASGT